MAKMTLEELRNLRQAGKGELNNRETHGKDILVVIGMGTCGIAAGAKSVLSTFVSELKNKGIENAIVKQTGCMGLCYVEPTVEIIVPGMPATIYGKVDSNVAKTIVQKHIMEKQLVSDHIFDKPAADIINK